MLAVDTNVIVRIVTQDDPEQALLLRRQLTRRFGPLPEWAERRLMDAEPAQLERWGERVLEAATLEAVLADG